jgi:hypothetical protein
MPIRLSIGSKSLHPDGVGANLTRGIVPKPQTRTNRDLA